MSVITSRFKKNIYIIEDIFIFSTFVYANVDGLPF